MIESRLDPLTDGIGGGDDGNRTVAQIAESFHYLAAEPVPMSVSAVLRILREQSQGRASRVDFVFGSTAFTVFVGLFFLLALFAPVGEERRNILVACPVMVLPFWAHVALTSGRRRRSAAQLQELRRLALESLEAIVLSPWFVPRSLDREERKSFQALRRSNPEAWARVEWILVGNKG